MKYLDINCALKLHDDIIREIGGLAGYDALRLNYLSSALEQIQNDDFYPQFEDKLAHLIFSCIKFHPFLDGNKRSSIYLAEHFARLNGVIFDENFFITMENVVVEIADNHLNKENLKEILEKLLKI